MGKETPGLLASLGLARQDESWPPSRAVDTGKVGGEQAPREDTHRIEAASPPISTRQRQQLVGTINYAKDMAKEGDLVRCEQSLRRAVECTIALLDQQQLAL